MAKTSLDNSHCNPSHNLSAQSNDKSRNLRFAILVNHQTWSKDILVRVTHIASYVLLVALNDKFVGESIIGVKDQCVS